MEPTPVNDENLSGRNLSVVIPAYNEASGIGPTLTGLIENLPDAEIIVVDDGSDDSTNIAARRFGMVTLARHPFNRGYGAGLKTGMRIATRDYVAWFDADNEHRATDLKQMYGRIVAEGAGAIIAQRPKSGASPLRGWGKAVIRAIARSLNYKGGADINCGLRVFRREVITRYLSLLPNGYSASITSTMIMLEEGYPLLYHNIELNERIGKSKVRIGDGFMAIMLVLRQVTLFAPLRIFLRVSFIITSIGVVYGLVTSQIVGQGLPAASVLLVLIGILIGMFGLIADQISQMRLSAYDTPIMIIDQDRRET